MLSWRRLDSLTGDSGDARPGLFGVGLRGVAGAWWFAWVDVVGKLECRAGLAAELVFGACDGATYLTVAAIARGITEA